MHRAWRYLLVEESAAKITRSAYGRGSKHAHTSSSLAEVQQLKMWIDAALGELLRIHRVSAESAD